MWPLGCGHRANRYAKPVARSAATGAACDRKRAGLALEVVSGDRRVRFPLDGRSTNRHYESSVIVSWIGPRADCERACSKELTRVACHPGNAISLPDPVSAPPANREQDASGVRRESGQADRLISTSPLNTLLCLHAWPINVVVFDEPDGEN